MKKISRKGFLKVAAAAAMSGVTASALAACNAGSSSSTAASTGEAIYTPGTYTGTATGIGEVKVTMTFSETAITDVVIDASNETESIGGVAAPTLKDALMAAQSTEIDNISGATITTNAVKKAAAGRGESPTESLAFLLEEQLARRGLLPELLAVCRYLAGLLDDDGRLDPEDLAELRTAGVPAELLERGVEVLQSLEPAGVGARSLATLSLNW